MVGSLLAEHRLQQLWWTGLVAPQHVDLPGPGTEPMSPALVGGFFTTEPAGKP